MRPRFTYVLLALVAALALAVAGCGGDDDDGGSEGDGPNGLAAATELLADIPQDGALLGDPDAPVKITEYLDVQCPFCKRASEELVPDLVTEYVKPGTASLEARPLSLIGDASGDGALGAYAAGEQDRMWEFLETLFANQGDENGGWLDRGLMEEVVAGMGIDAAKWGEDFTSDAAASWVSSGQTQAANDQADGVPHFVIEGPNGREIINGLGTIDSFRETIESVS